MAQILQKKMNTTTVTAKPITQSANKQQQSTKSPVMEAKKNVAVAQVSKKISFVKLDSKNPSFQKLMAKSNVDMSKYIKHFPPSKLYTYPDGSKSRVSVSVTSNGSKWPNNLNNPNIKSKTSSSPDSCSCIVQTVSLSSNSTNFMNNNFANNATYLLPGAVYYYDDLMNGKFKQITDTRYPIILTTDNSNIDGDSYVVIENPDQVNLQDGVTKLKQRFTKDINLVGNGTYPYKVYESSNSSDMSLKIGADVTGYGFSASADYGRSSSSHDEKLTVDAYKELFSISAAIPTDSTFKGYFKTYPDDTHFPVIISSVHYGERVLANMEAKFKSQSEAADLNASYDGFIAKADVALSYFSSSSSIENNINAYYVGGPSQYTTLSFDKKDLENQLKNFFSNVTYQTTQPISYELQDLYGNPIAAVSATDNFAVPLCAFNSNISLIAADLSKPLVPKIYPNSSYAYVKTANSSGDNKDPDTHWSLGIFDSNGNSVASFHDDSNNNPYNSGTTTGHLVLVSERPATFGDFLSGGRIHINVAPNGNDNWNVDEFTIFLNFISPDGSTVKTQKLTWNHIHLSQDRRDVDLSFKYDTSSNSLTTLGGGDW